MVRSNRHFENYQFFTQLNGKNRGNNHQVWVRRLNILPTGRINWRWQSFTHVFPLTCENWMSVNNFRIVWNFNVNYKFVRNFVRNLSAILICCPKIYVRKFNVRNLTVRNVLYLMYIPFPIMRKRNIYVTFPAMKLFNIAFPRSKEDILVQNRLQFVSWACTCRCTLLFSHS